MAERVTYAEIATHMGHRVEAVVHGWYHAVVQCVDCSAVIVDADRED